MSGKQLLFPFLGLNQKQREGAIFFIKTVLKIIIKNYSCSC